MPDKSVLLAYGEGAARDSVPSAVSSRGYDCRVARDGAGALASFVFALANPPPFDILICGMNLPGLSGTKLVNKIIGLDPFFPVIIVSALEDFKTARANILGGSWEYLREPFGEKELLEALDRQFEKTRTAREEAHTYRVINSLIEVLQDPME